jgi:long-chain acyl-CoA synthetase
MVSAAPGVSHFYMVGGVQPGFESFEETVDLLPTSPIDDQCMGAPMLYSSGTTGKPKGIFIPPHTDQWDAPLGLTGSIGAAFGFGPETTYLSPAPLYHAAPLHYNMVVLDSGGTSVVMEKFDPRFSLFLRNFSPAQSPSAKLDTLTFLRPSRHSLQTTLRAMIVT